ncbi:hypothetical protein AB0A95_33790 [Micromonospora sp. NPDC049230]|uniref:hypothetical protein n=1 Tax=Micromonospora sp. NPDC049230 TaxID=3155502 RepID=UPI0033F789C7
MSAGVGDDGEIKHAAWEAAAEALHDNIATWSIPDDGTGVADTDTFIASISGFLNAFAGVLDDLVPTLGGGESPVAAVVADQLQEFSGGLRAMAGDAGEVYEAWATNEDNDHDLRRANGDVSHAELFNVTN